MNKIQDNIIEYFQKKSTDSMNIILSPRNVSKNLGIRHKVAKTAMYKLPKLERVKGRLVGSNKTFKNIILYRLTT